ncbi:MAG TPA: matrixin family metalloprotease [Verrucomicrobiae bacterium]|nr:matrixin family metalloprotease [Verrucomicrobiae bacterium]
MKFASLRIKGATFLLTLLALVTANASSTLPLTPAELLRDCGGAFRGTILGSTSYRGSNGLIFTRTDVRVDETFKGTLPRVVRLVHRGGAVAGEDELFGLSPTLIQGQEYLLFVNRNASGVLHCPEGPASAVLLNGTPATHRILQEVRQQVGGEPLPGDDGTDQEGSIQPVPQAITGMLQGVNSRFVQPDRGEPIPYIIDANALPAGITFEQATNAVREALDAWASVTSLKFALESIESFGQGADAVALNDGKLRLQLHDIYSRIEGSSVLGIGGRSASTSALSNGWNLGGRVNDTEFRRTGRGYVVLKHDHSTMQNLATFTEVLCHEIGHALNLAHSSEVPTADPLLLEAMMYYLAHADGRGATLGAYDPPIIQQIYPANTPPFTFHRMLDVITAPSTPEVPGINEVEARGYDLQPTDLTMETAEASAANGSFSIADRLIRYTPNGYYNDSARLNPAGGSSWDSIYVRFSDGTNASPYARIRVISLRGDGYEPSDGLPDYWMLNFFGHEDPRSDDLSRANDDADGDGMTNLQEYLAATHPTSSGSALRIAMNSAGVLEVPVKPFDPYDSLTSTNLVDWIRAASPLVSTNASAEELTALPQTAVTAVISNSPASSPHLFFRVEKIP